MELRHYAMKPTGDGDSCALACVSSTISPWARFGAATHALVQNTRNGVVRPKGLSEGSTV
ncbi:MAG: hypothetical protein M3083_11510 [Actinomycetota bacterium]|nr:hypothetical protein [Actinomycetota bacterium]MDQ6949393.1 hypothetical protein [Actinomycetota bacterium]